MTSSPKSPRIRDKKYRNSFKIYGEHTCLISGVVFSEYSSDSVDGAHISIGNYARGMKAYDDLILPLRHDLHLEFDRNQEAFIDIWRDSFILWGETMGVYWICEFCGSFIDFVKACARAYYENWKTKEKENE